MDISNQLVWKLSGYCAVVFYLPKLSGRQPWWIVKWSWRWLFWMSSDANLCGTLEGHHVPQTAGMQCTNGFRSTSGCVLWQIGCTAQSSMWSPSFYRSPWYLLWESDDASKWVHFPLCAHIGHHRLNSYIQFCGHQLRVGIKLGRNHGTEYLFNQGCIFRL
jgi:hypothetical protein